MDQLHEELKEVTPPPPETLLKGHAEKYRSSKDNIAAIFMLYGQKYNNDEERSQCSSPSLSQSEAEYETCDSGVSEQSSLSDEVPQSTGSHTRFSRSPSPTSTIPPPSTVNNTATSSTYQRHSKSNQSVSSRAHSQTTSSPNASIKSQSSSTSSVQNSSSAQNSSSSTQSPSASETSTGSSNKSKQPPHRSIISDVFDGKLLSSVQCLTCDRISTREETFQDLSLPIPGKDHLTVLHQNQGITGQQQLLHQMQQQMQQQAPMGVTCTDSVITSNLCILN